MTFRSIRLIAASLAVAGLSACQTASVDTTTTSAFQVGAKPSPVEQKVAFARKQFDAGNYGLAERNFREAVEARPQYGEAWIGLAASYDELGRFDLSDRAYSELLKIEGRKASILNNQGYSYILRGDMAKARNLLREAKALAPESDLIDQNLQLASAG